ncbi:unnamed protein product [Cylindrotheca closterium]|uniref:Glycolipid transfer protein domain-containing protein n=1 Tax=Cylindrotheca closterium TaxID=2856 RepID=A0AAD2G6Q1_9STRA|nr:unnamed protein product [Cylindrotheca closterium]
MRFPSPACCTLFLLLVSNTNFGDASTRVSTTSPSTTSTTSSFLHENSEILTPSSALAFDAAAADDDDDNEVVSLTSSICTDAASLASDFQKALVVMNQQKDDIHVGHLLSACEGLEATMRRIGFAQGASDIAANLSKIRTVYHQVSPDKRDSMPEILQYEKTMMMTDSKAIKDTSATMGLLWLGRSLNYQYDMFQQLLLDVNVQPYEAAYCAYERNMKPHLSWPLQKVCQVALKKLKVLRRERMLACIGGFSEECYGACEDQATRHDLQRVVRCLEPMLGRWRQVFSDMGLGDI